MKKITSQFLFVMILIASLSLFWVAQVKAAAGGFTAKIFALNSNTSKDPALFTMKHEESTQDGITQFHNFYNYPDGREAVIEDVELKGTDLVSYHYVQKQLGSEGHIKVKDGKVLFDFKHKNEDAKTSEETYVDNLVVGPSLVPYMKKNWDKLRAGDKLKVRLAVPDRRESLGFDLLKDKSSSEAKTIIKMKASNFVISAVVDPLYFTFTPDGSFMSEMKGRTQPKKEHDGQFSDIDAYTVYKLE